jgi:hypothetical protein
LRLLFLDIKFRAAPGVSRAYRTKPPHILVESAKLTGTLLTQILLSARGLI